MNWEKIYINSQSIDAETERAYLIKMPSKSKYKGWAFWHPKKLVRVEGGKGYHLSFSFTEEFEFKILLYGRGKYNKKSIIRDDYLTPDDIKEVYGVVNNEIDSSIYLETKKIIDKEEVVVEIKHHEPEKIEPINDNTIEDLKNG